MPDLLLPTCSRPPPIPRTCAHSVESSSLGVSFGASQGFVSQLQRQLSEVNNLNPGGPSGMPSTSAFIPLRTLPSSLANRNSHSSLAQAEESDRRTMPVFRRTVSPVVEGSLPLCSVSDTPSTPARGLAVMPRTSGLAPEAHLFNSSSGVKLRRAKSWQR